MSTVPHENKFSRYDPCPICGGDPSQPHGSGRRCWGFYSNDRKRAHCTREEYAGGLPQHPNSSTFAHRLGGACKCGATHGEAGDVPDCSGWRPKARRTHDQMIAYWTRQGYRYVTTYMICDAAGVLVACHDRFEHPSQPKVCPFRLHDGLEGLDGLPKSQLPLYRSETIRKAPAGAPIYLTEGEKACEALRKYDLIAVATVTGAGGLPRDDSLHVLSGRMVTLWPDNDVPGRSHIAEIAKRLVALGIEHSLLEWPDAPPKGDADDYFGLGGTVEELESLIGDGAQADKVPALLGVSMADVEVEDIHWLWHQRIALGKITMFDGDGGVGKSLVTLDLVGRVAMGRSMPDGSPGLGDRAGVVVICGEDGLADTVKPRLMAAGVSPEALRSVRAVNLVPEPLADGTISQRLISLMRDLPTLEETIIAIGAKLLIVDPLTAYLGDGVDAYKDSEVRRVLTPLALMAERTGIAVVLVRHLNRSTSATAQHRGLGSVAFLNLARLGLLFAPNPDAEGEYLVSRVKGNIGKPPPTMGYRITQFGDAENMPKVEWLGERETSADVALASLSGAGTDSETRSATDEAMEWLQAYLANGPRPADEVTDEAVKARLISDDRHDKPLRTARTRLGITIKSGAVYREGGIAGGGQWMWRLLSAEVGHLSENCPDEQAAKPEFKGSSAKMPSPENAGHLSTALPPKMPSENEAGHLSATPEFNDTEAAPETLIPPKMPSPVEPIGAGNLSTDAQEPLPPVRQTWRNRQEGVSAYD